MSTSLPFAVRVAAGLVSEALGRARRLPADISTLPVTVLGQVAKFSFELNQQLAELAGEGDRLIAGLKSADEPPQRTAWSTIDDEDDVAARDPQAAATWGGESAAAATPPTATPPTAVPADDPRPAPASPRLVIDDDAPPTTAPSTTAPSTTADTDTAGVAAGPGTAAGTRPPGPRSAGRRAGATPRSAGARVTTAPDTPMDRALLDDIGALEVDRPAPLVGLPSPAEDVTRDPVDISSMSIGQLRGRVRGWPVDQVRSALEQEQREKARPAFLTVLTNRLSTLARGGA